MVKEKNGFLEWLKKEITSWKMKGWITRANGLHILSYYGVTTEIDTKRDPAYIRPWFFVFGLVLTGFGIIAGGGTGASLLPRTVMTVLLFAGIILIYAVGYYLYYLKKCNNIIAEIIVGLGILLFGYSLWYFNQAYNIFQEPATLFFFWSVGFLPLVLMFPFKYILWLNILGFTAWTVAAGTHFHAPHYWYLPVALFILFPLIYFRNTSVGLVLGILGLSFWAGVVLNAYSSSLQIFLPVFFILWSLFLFVLAEFHSKLAIYRRFAPVYQVLGLVFGFLSLSFTSLHALGLTQARFLLKNEGWLTGRGMPIIIFAGVVTLLAIIFLLAARFKKPTGFSWTIREFLVFGIMAISAWAYFLFPEQIPKALEDSLLSQLFLVYPMIFTLVLFLFVIWVIYSGIRQKLAWLLNLGVLMAVVSIFARYFDNFLPMLPKNLFLIIGGVVLLLVGVFYKKEKQVTAQ